MNVRLSCGCPNVNTSYRQCPSCGYTRCNTCKPHKSCQPSRIGAATRRRRPEPVVLPAPIPTGEPTFEVRAPRCHTCDALLAECVCYDEQLTARAAS